MNTSSHNSSNSDNSVESNRVLVINKLKSQIKAANSENERLKTEIYNLKEELAKTKYYPDQISEQNAKEKMLEEKINELTNENQHLIAENTYLKEENYKMRNSGANTVKQCTEQELPPPEIYMKRNSSNSFVTQQKITQMIEQHKIELEIRDKIIRKLQSKAKDKVSIHHHSSHTDYVEESFKNEEREHNEKKRILKLELKYKEDIDKLKDENSSLRKKCKKYERKAKDLEHKYDEVIFQINSVKQQQQLGSREKYNETSSIKDTLERDNQSRRIRELEEELAEEKDKYFEYQEKANKAELELEELRNFLRIVANNEAKLKQLGINKAEIFQEIERIGGKIDEIGCFAAFGGALHPRRKKRVH